MMDTRLVSIRRGDVYLGEWPVHQIRSERPDWLRYLKPSPTSHYWVAFSLLLVKRDGHDYAV